MKPDSGRVSKSSKHQEEILLSISADRTCCVTDSVKKGLCTRKHSYISVIHLSNTGMFAPVKSNRALDREGIHSNLPNTTLHVWNLSESTNVQWWKNYAGELFDLQSIISFKVAAIASPIASLTPKSWCCFSLLSNSFHGNGNKCLYEVWIPLLSSEIWFCLAFLWHWRMQSWKHCTSLNYILY